MSSVLILGGTGGLGSAMVRKFAGEGEDVVFTYLRAEDAARSLVDETAALQGKVRGERLDVRDVERIQEIVGLASAELRCVILSAASGVQRPLRDTRSKHWQWCYDVNTRPLIPLFQASFDALTSSRGSIIACTAIGSRVAVPSYGLVGAAKASVEALIRYIAYEAGPSGIRANALCPGAVATKALNAFPEAGRGLLETVKRTPLGRLVTPEEVADIAYWLAGPQAEMITGQVIVVDGGFEIAGPFAE